MAVIVTYVTVKGVTLRCPTADNSVLDSHAQLNTMCMCVMLLVVGAIVCASVVSAANTH
jgi:uncharacterized membrane protein